MKRVKVVKELYENDAPSTIVMTVLAGVNMAIQALVRIEEHED